MQSKIVAFLYQILPPRIINYIGRTSVLKGIRTLLLRKNKEELTHTVNIVDTKLGIDFQFEAPVKVAVRALKHGIETGISKALLQLFNHSEDCKLTIVDVGASNGYLTCFFAQTLAKNGTVLSYEPHPTVYKRLVTNLQCNNLSHVYHAQVALGNEHKQTDLFLYYETANKIRFAEKKVFNIISMTMTKLDQEIEKHGLTTCDVIKIDVDGYEEQVLLGAIKTISAHHPVIVFETNQKTKPGQILIENGYGLFDTNLHQVENTKELPHDMIAIHHSRLNYHFKSG